MGDVDAAPIDRLVGFFSALPQVEAVALGGSRSGTHADAASDFDIYVCTNDAVPLETRRNIVQRSGGASAADLGLDFFGPGTSGATLKWEYILTLCTLTASG